MYTSEEIGKNTWLILECGYDAIYYLEGDEKGLLIDTGVGAGNLKEYIDKNIASKPYDVLLTHGHLDHIGAILQYPKILVNEKDWEMVKNSITNEDRRHFLENMKEMSEGRVENQDSSNMILYNGYLPELVDIADGAVINLGNRELQVHATPGHTQGSICLTDSQENIAIVGDTIIYRLLLMTGPKDLHERLKIWWESTKFLYEGDYRAWYMDCTRDYQNGIKRDHSKAAGESFDCRDGRNQSQICAWRNTGIFRTTTQSSVYKD